MKEKLDEYRKKLIDEIGERSVQIIVGIIIASLSVVWTGLYNPRLKIKNIKIDIIRDKLTISNENKNPNIGKTFTLTEEDIQKGKVNLSEKEHFYAPELKVELRGKGKNEKAYIIYKQKEIEDDIEDNWIFQKLNVKSNFVEHYEILFTKKITFICNYSTLPTEENKLMYLVLIGEKSKQYTYCIKINMDKKETEYKKIEEIYEITPYQKGFWGMRKIEIQKNYEMIQKKIKEKV